MLSGGVDDDRGSIDVADRVVLIVEDDETFARTVLEVARERGFKGIVALRGDAGLALAHEYKPDAIVLDMALPGMDGWAVLDHLKRHPDTRHIPVHVVTGAENGKQHALRAGAVAFLEKPVEKSLLDEAFSQISGFLDRRVRNLLVVDDESAQRQALTELLGDGEDINVTAVGSSEEALAELEQGPYDCMVLDLKLPDMQGFQLLERVKSDERFSKVPVIIYTAKQLTRKEETALRRYAETIVVKDVNSPERLLDETTLFLHRVESRLPAEKRKLLQQLHSADAVFEGKKVLIVDDDVRNVFALSNVLEARRMDVRYAENGLDALKLLERGSGRRRRPDGHHDAGARRLRDDPPDPGDAAVRGAADHLADREGHEGRPREVDRRRRLGLHHEARRHRQARLVAPRMAVRQQRSAGLTAASAAGGDAVDLEKIELDCLLEAVFRRYGFDFREYAPASLRRRVNRRLQLEGLPTISALQERLLRDPDVMERLLLDLSINVTAMFRDPSFYRRTAREGRAAAQDLSVHADLGRRLLDGRGGVLARDPARRGEGLRPGADLRDGHQRGRARARAPRRLPAREDAGLHAELHRGRRQARVRRLLHVGVRRRRVRPLAAAQRRLRAAQPRFGPVVQRVPHDRLPQRDDLLRTQPPGARLRPLRHEPACGSGSSRSATRSRCG